MAEQSDTINLHIVTPNGEVATLDVATVTVSGIEGEFGVLPGHAPFLTQLRPGLIRYEEGGMPRSLVVTEGIVEVSDDKVIVLARTAETKDEVDLPRAEEAKQKLETTLAAMADDDEARPHQEEKLRRAEARIDFANDRLNFY